MRKTVLIKKRLKPKVSFLDKVPQSFRGHFADLLGQHADARFYASKYLGMHGKNSLVPLFKVVAKNPNPQIAAEGLSLIARWGTTKDLSFINRFMYSPNSNVREIAIELMGLTKEKKAKEFLQKRLESADTLLTRKSTLRALSFFKPRAYELYGELSENKKFKDPKRKIVRLPHVKDGSTTVLLGGKLYDKAIIRGGATIATVNGKREKALNGLRENAVSAWRTALEFDWKGFGLDHTPIEPILKKNGKYRIFRNKDGTYRVSAGVIRGESYYSFLRKHKVGLKVREELERQARRIAEGLGELGIDHSHLHQANMIVTMEKNKPKLYVIDFDAAGFSRNRITILTNPNYGY